MREDVSGPALIMYLRSLSLGILPWRTEFTRVKNLRMHNFHVSYTAILKAAPQNAVRTSWAGGFVDARCPPGTNLSILPAISSQQSLAS